MRGLIVFTFIIVLYYALKTVVRSALRSYHEEGTRTAIKGEDMVLDPVCHTYVVKDRAVTRRIRGTSRSFCSEACARQFEEGRRD